MTHDQVQEWLDRYISAWRSGDPVAIKELFSHDAVYGYRPWDREQHTVRGSDLIAASWLESPDDPSSWEAAYAPYVVEGDKAVALGTTRYFATGEHPERLYHNAYVLAFDDDGRCSSFHEFFVLDKD
ncbi:MAG: nuclear transport factor 2 family protein [Acidimicrobiia bacterium]